MKAQCLPFSQIPHTTRLFADYLAYTPNVRDFYPRSPNLRDWVTQENPANRYDEQRRRRIADVLERQNRAWDASAATLDNLNRFRSGASVIVTGQQVGLFGGPAFSIYKALTAVKLAAEAKAAGVETVPVFWLATNDHDLAEVNHAWLAGAENVPEPLTTPTHGAHDAPVGTVVFGSEIGPVVERAASLLGDSEIAQSLRDSYQSGETFGSAFARLMAQLFAEFGVILLDPTDVDFGAAAAPIYRAAIERAAELDNALLERGKALESAGYHQQVKVTSSTTLLFVVKDGARLALHRRNNGGGEFMVGDQKISQSELLGWIQARPQDFSPNVLLRPIVEDYLLPTVAYTGGAAEIAYFAQAGVVYERLLGRTTPVLPRFSATLIEPKEKGLLDKYHLQVPDLFHGSEILQQTIAARVLPSEVRTAFERSHGTVEKALTEVTTALQRLDPTLLDAAGRAGSKIRYQLHRLQSRAARAQLSREETISRHAARLSHALFPHKALQEREIAGISYLAKHGKSLLSDLYPMIHTDCHDHQVISLD